MLLLTISSFTTKEMYSKIVVTITYFFYVVTHLLIYTSETETEMSQKALQSV